MHLYAYKSVAMSMMSEIGSITNNSQSILIESILPTMMAFPSISKTIIYTKEKVLSTKEKLKNYFEINHEEFNILYYEIEEYNEKMYHLITLSKNISKESISFLLLVVIFSKHPLFGHICFAHRYIRLHHI